MAKFVLSSVAETDIEEILAWTQEHFGESARLRYEAIIVQAILDIAADTERPGAWLVRNYPRELVLTFCSTAGTTFLPQTIESNSLGIFCFFASAAKEKLRLHAVLHDSMDLAQHLPADLE